MFVSVNIQINYNDLFGGIGQWALGTAQRVVLQQPSFTCKFWISQDSLGCYDIGHKLTVHSGSQHVINRRMITSPVEYSQSSAVHDLKTECRHCGLVCSAVVRCSM